MDKKRLQEIEARAKKASTAPWTVEVGGYSGENWLLGSISIYLGNDMDDREDYCVHITTDHVHASELRGQSRTDAEFIAHARQDIPDLIDEVYRLQDSVKRPE